jgi:cellobiose phosphorylase
VIAECLQGNGDQAWEYYRSFMPAAYNDRAEVREVEPYVHCQTTYSTFNVNQGASRVPWLSGTASWAYYSATHWLLGVRPEVEGLRIDPCIPKTWPGFTMTRVFRGKRLKIEVRNSAGVNRGVKLLTLDGQPLEGNLVPVEKLKDGAKIVAELG